MCCAGGARARAGTRDPADLKYSKTSICELPRRLPLERCFLLSASPVKSEVPSLLHRNLRPRSLLRPQSISSSTMRFRDRFRALRDNLNRQTPTDTAHLPPSPSPLFPIMRLVRIQASVPQALPCFVYLSLSSDLRLLATTAAAPTSLHNDLDQLFIKSRCDPRRIQ